MLDNTITKTYFTIGEVAKLIGEAPSLIRFWEKEFAVLKPQKTDKGTRKYTEKDVEMLRLIHQLVKQKGYTLQGAADYIKNQSNLNNTTKIVDTLVRLKHFLETVKKKLD